MNKIFNKLQQDILKRHIGPFIFCFFTVMFLLLMQFLMLYIDKLVGKGLPLGVVLELIITNLAAMVVLAAPMAVLVASLMAFGKFTELNELTALRAAGVNPFQIIKPVLFAGVVLSLFLIWFSNDVLPDSNQRARSLFIDIRLKKPGFDLKPNEFYDGIEGYTFLVKRITNESDSLYDVTLFQERDTKRKKAVIKARKGSLKSEDDGQTLTLYLFDGSIVRYMSQYRDGRRVDVLEKTGFDRYRMSFDLSEMAFSQSNPDQHSRNDRTMNIQSMQALVDSLHSEIDTETQKVIEKNNYPVEIKEDSLDIVPLRMQHATERYSREDTVNTTPYKSNYLMLNQLSKRARQKALNEIALSNFRNSRAAFENLENNLQWRITRISRYTVEIYKKFSIPIACLIFVLIGAPIGMYTKKGNLGYAALISTGFLTFYWISIIQGEKLADRLYITPFTGMWFSDILLAIIGIYMVVRLCTSFKISKLWNRE